MRQVEGMETDAVDERPPSASPASPTRKEKRNDTTMGKATPRAPRSADLGRCRFWSDGCAPSPAGGAGEGAVGSITWMGDPSLGCRRSPDAGEGSNGRAGPAVAAVVRGGGSGLALPYPEPALRGLPPAGVATAGSAPPGGHRGLRARPRHRRRRGSLRRARALRLPVLPPGDAQHVLGDGPTGVEGGARHATKNPLSRRASLA